MTTEHRIVKRAMARLGTVECVYVGRRWVGTVARDPERGWFAQHRGEHVAVDRDAALAEVLRHAEAEPDFDLA